MRCIISVAVKNNLSGLILTINSILKEINKENDDFFAIDIIDGLSTDGSVRYIKDLISRMGGKKLRLIEAEPKGVYNAMNIGVMARNPEDWSWHINSGDILVADLSHIKSILTRNNNEYDLIVGKCGIFFKENPDYFFVKNKTNELPHQSCIYKNNLHSVYGYYNEKFVAFSDTQFLKKINPEKILRADAIFSATYVSPENISRRPESMLHDMRKLDSITNLSPSMKFEFFVRMLILKIEKKIGNSFSVLLKINIQLLFGMVDIHHLK